MNENDRENEPQPSENLPEKKMAKAKGPIRVEAIIPVALIIALSYGYFAWLFDSHLKKGFEYVLTQANGAEANIRNISTSFFSGSFLLQGLEMTDKNAPKLNALEIERISFKFVWDALLRAKFVINEAAVEGIKISSPRKNPGFVLPPEPPKPSQFDALKTQMTGQIKKRYQENALANAIALLEGSDPKDQIQAIRDELKAEKRALEMTQDLKTKKDFWDEEIKRLTDQSKIKQLDEEIKSIKAEKNFAKQVSSAKDALKLVKEIEKQAKEIKRASQKLESEVKLAATYPTELKLVVQEDIKSLKEKFKIPMIEVSDLAQSLFMGQFGSYLSKAREYQALAKQYLPEKKEREEVLPPPRSSGKNYEFPITKGYPLFWLKRAAVSSKDSPGSYRGDISGEIKNISTSPKMLKQPTVITLEGNFPEQGVQGAKLKVDLNFHEEIPSQNLLMTIQKFKLEQKLFAKSDKITFGFSEASASAQIQGEFVQDRLNFSWKSQFFDPKWIAEAKSDLVQEILSDTINGLPTMFVEGTASGNWKDIDMKLESNIGDEIAIGLQTQLSLKVQEAEDKLKAMIDEKMKNPQELLNLALKGNNDQLEKAQKFVALFQDKEKFFKEQLENLQKPQKKAADEALKKAGKKLLKGFKLK